MPRKRNAASRDWVCNLSDGTCIDESQLEYTEEPVEGLEEAAWDCVLDSIDVNNPVLLPKYKELLTYLFKAGAEWMKAKMMEEAVEADVNTYKDPILSCGWAEFVVDMPSTETDKLGDKVRIIVIKEGGK